MGEKHWYVVHTYSGYENRVQDNLMRKVESLGMQDRVLRAVVPMENVVEEKNGKRVIVQRKLYPGYVLVEMVVEPDTWYAVRNTPGVTGFVGSEKVPVPLTDSEAERLLRSIGVEIEDKREKIEIKVKVGENVRIREGAFTDFIGKVLEINESRGTITVSIDMFGRETRAEVDYFQIEEIQ
ncbi:MAG: transcription termination/antitermination protein NusG [Acidaminococcaceae bacterium]|nr:transcription termination/antitermination protein NusG [Acidaminococcaceae bacterium]MDO4935319.1 transcription termination/antitermination protein NusG [Phascolarctobacterium sp.]